MGAAESHYHMDVDRFGTLAYPVSGATTERPLLACWVLVLLGFLVPVLPLIPFVGYLVRVLVVSARGDPDPPAFLDDLSGLVRLGLGGTVVAVGYLAVPVVLLLVTVNGALGFSGELDGFVESLLFFSGSTIVLTLSLVAVYLFPVALISYGRERRLRAAVDRATVLSLPRRLNVFVGWAIGFVVVSVGAGVATAVLGRFRLGPVLASLVVAYTLVLASQYIGRAVARAER